MQNSNSMTIHLLRDIGLSVAAPETFLSLVSAVSDLAIFADAQGHIRKIISNMQGLETVDFDALQGVPVIDTVTEESRLKIRDMLSDAREGAAPRWREVNHVFAEVGEIPVRYQAIPAGEHVMLLGREMRSVAALQARLVEVQRALDEDYGRRRQLETRYRVLFQTSEQPLLIADARTGRIQEVNAASGRILDAEPEMLIGRKIDALFAPPARAGIREHLDRLVSTGEGGTLSGPTEDGGQTLEMRATVFRAADSMILLCRLEEDRESRAEPVLDEMVLNMVGRVPDAMVLTDSEGRILWTNDAFLGLAEIALESQVRGQSLSRFIGRPGVDLDIIIENAREHGRLRAFSLQFVGAFGSATNVEISAAVLPEAGDGVVGFVIRDISRYDQIPMRKNGTTTESVDSLIHLVGTVPLKELVRSSTEEIERMCIETALKMTGNNRASAAEVLGLSRQSLYVKLRRFGLIEANDAN